MADTPEEPKTRRKRGPNKKKKEDSTIEGLSITGKKAKEKAEPEKKEKPKKPKNYLNNKDMMAELRRCHEQDKMTEEFAKMIMLLADRYSKKVDYLDYSPHIEDMKAVAVANVVRAWRSFDLERFNNPFAYFTQAIKHTFWQYVHQEKKHRLNRDALLISIGELPSDAYMEEYEKEMAALREEHRGDQNVNADIDMSNDYNDYDDYDQTN